jgi:hypothetical protein
VSWQNVHRNGFTPSMAAAARSCAAVLPLMLKLLYLEAQLGL